MKKFLIGLLTFILILSFVGCGKIEEKAGEAIAEKIMEEAGAGDVDIDGDKVTITGEDGGELTFGETDWPTSELAKIIPEFKDGKIVTVMEMGDSLLIGLEEVSKEDFTDYLDEIKKIFTDEAYNMSSEGNITYGAQNSDGFSVMISYITDETLSIAVQKITE